MGVVQLGIVAQSNRTASVCIPSKTFNILAAGKPIVAIGSSQSDLADILNRYRCGKVFSVDQGAALAEHIKMLSEDYEMLAELSSAAGLAALDFTSDNASQLIDEVFSAHA